MTFAFTMGRSLSRDHGKLRVFAQADAPWSCSCARRRRFLRSNALAFSRSSGEPRYSAAANIVEGCARRSTREYVNFLNVANGALTADGSAVTSSTSPAAWDC